MEHLQATRLELKVKDKDVMTDDFVGNVQLDLNEIPMRVPPDSPLAPQWYRLEDQKGEKISNGELMLAVWYGTQADEAFSDAFHFDSIGPSDMTATYIRSKVYHPPRLWYLRVNIIQAQDLIVSENFRYLDCFVKVQLGAQNWQTKHVQTWNGDTLWDDEGFFVAAEPFDEYLSITVVDRLSPKKEETLGKVSVSLLDVRYVKKRHDDKNFPSQWINLQRPSSSDTEQEKKVKFSSKLETRIILDGGYHVLNESVRKRGSP